MQLRDYQADAIESAYQFLRNRPGENPCIVIPTGGGKTPILSTICHDAVSKWGGRVLVLSHVKELVEQSAATLRKWYKGLDVGVYSAGVGSRDKRNAIIVASIQSIYSKGLDIAGSDPFDLVLIDEAHRIPTDGDGQYQQLLADLSVANPKMRVIGLTATPYRMKGGYVCSADHFLNDICYEVSVRELIAKGYLSRLTSKGSECDADLSSVSIQRGEYSAGEMEAAFDAIVDSAVAEIVTHAKDRKSVLVFCAGVDHAERVTELLRQSVGGEGVDCLYGSTNKHDRERIVNSFKSGATKYLCNVNVLTEGFDATRVDMVVLLRATLSPGLYYQMVGRGLRLHEGKENCIVLDFGSNVATHGPIDAIKVRGNKSEGTGEKPTRTCPECKEIVPINYSNCSACGFAFPGPEQKPRHEPKASNAAILSEDVPVKHYMVTEVFYAVHHKKDWTDGQPRTLRVDYFDGPTKVASEWICLEHDGYAKGKALLWWSGRCAAKAPKTIEEAVAIGNLDLILQPIGISVRDVPGTRFTEIVNFEFAEGAEIEAVDQEWLDNHLARATEDDEVPF
jgi:DNA repair protein RadD